MHIEARLFEFLTAFFVLSAVVYAVLTAMFAHGGVEWAGVTALVMTSGLTLITGTFFRFVARRLDTRPEDYEDAEIVRLDPQRFRSIDRVREDPDRWAACTEDPSS